MERGVCERARMSKLSADFCELQPLASASRVSLRNPHHPELTLPLRIQRTSQAQRGQEDGPGSPSGLGQSWRAASESCSGSSSEGQGLGDRGVGVDGGGREQEPVGSWAAGRGADSAPRKSSRPREGPPARARPSPALAGCVPRGQPGVLCRPPGPRPDWRLESDKRWGEEGSLLPGHRAACRPQPGASPGPPWPPASPKQTGRSGS